MEKGIRHILTVDFEEWFHGLDIPYENWCSYESRIEQNTETLLQIFEECGVRATFFVVADIADKFPYLVRMIHDAGHEIGSHGYIHQRYTQISPEEIREDINKSIQKIACITGEHPMGFRAPCFSLNEGNSWILDYLIENDIRYDSSLFPIKLDRYGVSTNRTSPHVIRKKSGAIWEFPITPCRFGLIKIPFAGGAYFRLCPFCLMKKMFDWTARQQKVVTFYIHPWELDDKQPVIRIPLRLKWTHYTGLGKFEKKLRKLLHIYPFGPIRDYLESSHDASLLTQGI